MDIRIPDPHQSKKSTSDIETTKISPAEVRASEAGEKVKVKFDKFVQLIATHNFEGILQEHKHEDVIVSTNLLTDLANAHEEIEPRGRKVPVFFLMGVLIGILIAYLIIRF